MGAPFITTLLCMSLGLGTVITFSSSHWLLAWAGLEINTISILPIIAARHHPRAVEASTKYFLVQAAGAAMLLFATFSNAWLTGEWNITQTTHPSTTYIAAIALALKLGLAPLHLWMPEVLQGSELTVGLLLATWQKLAPVILLFQIALADTYLLTTLGLASTLLAGWAGLNQVQVRKILAYSSIAHMGWLIVVLPYSPDLALLALFLYILATAGAFYIFHVHKTHALYSFHRTPLGPSAAALAVLILLSLGGLPPLSGFVPKWLIIHQLVSQELYPLAVLMAMSALLSLFFYLRLSYALTITKPPLHTSSSPLWRLPTPKMAAPAAAFTIATLALLPVMPVVASILLR
uniref:NADH dehydrogenase subunit 2 n=1 Tax=Upeneus parvus TaxID=461258 RepID=UPI0028CFF44E|nr:NADH dehydrogenase subunit 2 [Upeneus parvus]WMY89695.1 NADH dehydrogenase subunit 2 [Upeneus parvus]